MKYIFLIITLFFSSSSFSKEYFHQVSLGTQGLGWSAAKERIPAQDSNRFDRVDSIRSNLGMNYAYRITARIQLGGFVQFSNNENQFHKQGGGVSKSEIETSHYGIFGLYNFSDELTRSFYVGLSVSVFNYEEENSHEFTEAENKGPFELDDRQEIIELIFGKRFGLEKFHIEHLTYSPQMSFFHSTHAKDFDDQGVGNGVGVAIQALKFDLLF